MAIARNGPTWVGQVERRDEFADVVVDDHFVAARLLVTAGGTPVGLATVELADGKATADEVRAAVEAQVGRDREVLVPPTSDEPITVVIATRNRAESVRRCVRAVLAGDHPDITVIVVDNDPDDDSTERVVAEFGEGGIGEFNREYGRAEVRYVRENRRGASVGRNRGLQEARTRIVAFTDDDTEADRHWASRIAGAFATDSDLACLSGPVVAARLDTEQERASEFGLVWNKGFQGRRFRLSEPPPGSAIFPFSPGLYGIGANFAVRAEAARRVGGMDEALGPGSPALGGEDGEFMVRLVLARYAVAYVPGVLVWHHHRSSPDELRKQVRGYAMGLGAFLTKIALDRRAGLMALQRLPAAVNQLRHINEREAEAGVGASVGAASTGAERLRWMLNGGSAYVRGRRAARRAGGRVPPLVRR
ncbi:glycosyltransferase family 2 protein [Pseudonocardia humida]|uniref:Glycosyltransferase n=1 Tax=Pseudonocardia humida TaxID=2800819 RepID=A0ABT0ZZ60_9PSEU|nr:glycosyltransferase [Pseudonocardia humida]MCO1656006.1 glycosyltransferase [Pseudonocardia humida]